MGLVLNGTMNKCYSYWIHILGCPFEGSVVPNNQIYINSMEWAYVCSAMVGFDFKIKLHVPGHMLVSFPAYLNVYTSIHGGCVNTSLYNKQKHKLLL